MADRLDVVAVGVTDERAVVAGVVLGPLPGFVQNLGTRPHRGVEPGPDVVAVVGFDDVPEAARFDPPLTTIRQPMQTLGATAAEMLITLMAGGTPASLHVQLPTQLVRRATTAPPSMRRTP